MGLGSYIEKASDSNLSGFFRGLLMRNNIWMIILMLLIYLAELGFFIYNSLNHLTSFQDRPHYEVTRIYKSDNSSHLTVNKEGSDKDCGHYGGKAHDIARFINSFPAGLAFGFFISYIVVYTVLFFFDMGFRIWKRCKSLRVNDSGSYQPMKGNRDILVDVLVLLFFILPIYKIVVLGILYPVTSIKYDSCINVKWDVVIDYQFYYYAMVGGFILTNGLLTFFSLFVFQNTFMRALFTSALAFISLGTCFVWTCTVTSYEMADNRVRGAQSTSCFCGLLLIVCTLYVPLYILFVMIGLPILTFNVTNVGLSISLIARVAVLILFELRNK